MMNGTRRGLAFALVLASLCGCAPVAKEPLSRPVAVAPVPAVPAATPAKRPAIKVALLLPITGSQSQLGRSLLDAGQMALYEADADVALLPFDTGDTPEQAKVAAAGALQQGAQVLIGPVFSNSVAAVKPLAQQDNVPLLALSNNPSLADANTFILGLGPDDQVRRVADYAEKHGLTRLAGLMPATPYGQAVEAALAKEAARRSLTVVHVERYTPGADSAYTVQALDAALTAKGGAQAVLVPEGGAALARFAPNLAALTPPLQLLGTTQWDRIDPHTPGLLGAVYPALADAGRSAFLARFNSTYGYAPAPLASFSYDAVKLALAQAKLGVIGLSPNRLTNPSGFTGTNGAYKLGTDGHVERTLGLYQITPTGLATVN